MKQEKIELDECEYIEINKTIFKFNYHPSILHCEYCSIKKNYCKFNVIALMNLNSKTYLNQNNFCTIFSGKRLIKITEPKDIIKAKLGDILKLTLVKIINQEKYKIIDLDKVMK